MSRPKRPRSRPAGEPPVAPPEPAAAAAAASLPEPVPEPAPALHEDPLPQPVPAPAARRVRAAEKRAPTRYDLPVWATDPPEAPDGLVPGSRFHEELWARAAYMLAQGSSFMQVSRAIGCSRTTLWRAYYGSQAFRVRVWWERQSADREAAIRLRSLRKIVTVQIERLIIGGDSATVRWMADRLGVGDTLGRDDTDPVSLREEPEYPECIPTILEMPEAEGPLGVVPYTATPDHDCPDLGEPPPPSRGRLYRGGR